MFTTPHLSTLCVDAKSRNTFNLKHPGHIPFAEADHDDEEKD